MAEKDSSVVKKEDENLSSEKFDEQTFLIHHFDEFVTKNESTNYKNFVPLTGEPAVLISKLLGTGIDEMFNIQPFQLSLLQPKIKLFKTVYGTNNEEHDVELIFNDFFRESKVEDIMKNAGQRGFGIGLKSFEWEDMGTNPGDTGKAFQSTLVLHAQRLEDLFAEQRDALTGEVSSFADLIRVPPKEFTDVGNYNNKYFRIKVQLGWQIPTESVSVIPEKLMKAIEASTITLFLTLTDHTIDLKEDGTATITATYIGAIEGKFLSAETDILYVDKNVQKSLRQAERLISDAKNREIQTKAQIDLTAKSDTRGSWQKTKDFVFNGFDSRTNDELTLIGINSEIEERLAAKEALSRENKANSYKRFLTSLEKKGRIYYVDVDKEDIKAFQRLRQQASDLENVAPDQLEKVKAQRLQKARQETKGTPFTIQQYTSAEPDNPIGRNGLASHVDSIAKQKDEKDREKAANEREKKFTEARQAKRHNKTRINFIYLGDIVETALSVIHGDEDNQVQTQKQDIRDNFRVLMGPIELNDVQTDQTHIKNLADIPISVDLFNAWFLKKVIRPQLDKYLLRDFLRDLCSELVVKAVSSDPSNTYSKAGNGRISFSVFSLGTGNDDPFSPGGEFGNTRLNQPDLATKDGALARMRSTDVSKMKHYFMIYVAGHAPHQLTGEYKEDISKGIYHLFFGADRGLVKKISFSKTDMQYQKEARIVNQSKMKNGDIFFVEPYNAKAELWGTSVFKPGMMVYIDPKSIGMPKSIPKNKRIPLGGYFTIFKVFGKIEPGKFETSIDLQWESSGEDKDTSPFAIAPVVNKEKTIDMVPKQ